MHRSRSVAFYVVVFVLCTVEGTCEEGLVSTGLLSCTVKSTNTKWHTNYRPRGKVPPSWTQPTYTANTTIWSEEVAGVIETSPDTIMCAVEKSRLWNYKYMYKEYPMMNTSEFSKLLLPNIPYHCIIPVSQNVVFHVQTDACYHQQHCVA